jgi:hemolysin D
MIRASVADEKKRQVGQPHVDATGFLPAALEVIKRPVSPTARPGQGPGAAQAVSRR